MAERYHYQETNDRSRPFWIYDGEQVIAYCRYRNDAERIVDALQLLEADEQEHERADEGDDEDERDPPGS